MKKKRILFHIGTPKTGTTALQTFFSRHHVALRAAGVDYPYAEDAPVIESGACVGNIVKMVFEEGFVRSASNRSGFPNMANTWSNEVVDFIASLIEQSDCDTVLFSSESMSNLNDDIVKAIKQRLAKRFDCKFIIFVRDPYDFFYSAWKQLLKSHFSTSSFEHYIHSMIASRHPREGMFTAFRTYWNNDLPLQVINYDSYKGELARVFLEVADIALDSGNRSPLQSGALHNRSLSASEAHLQWLVNQRFEGTSFPAFLRFRLLQRDRVSGCFDYYDKDIDTLLINHFGELISRINRVIQGEPLRSTVREKDSDTLHIETDDLDTLIESFRFVDNERHRKMPLTNKARHWLRCVLLKHVPHDFNPEAYLLMNRDVAAAGVDPYLHFSRNGHLEGRPYKYW